MTKFKETEIFIVDTNQEADGIIQEARNAVEFELVGSKITLKEKKVKGEVVDSHLLVEIKKAFCPEWDD